MAPPEGARLTERRSAPPRPTRPASRPPAGAPREPRPPRAQELTEERREAILAAYGAQTPQADEPLRKVYIRIAAELHVTRKMVADVLKGIAGRVEPTDELRQAVGERYRQFVRAMERPPESRHSLLAREYGLTRLQVSAILQSLQQDLPDPQQQEPIVLFRIEQAYWRHLHRDATALEQIPDAIAAEQGVHPWVAARYLDLIHDDPRRLQKTPLPDAETQQRILAGYKRFLSGDAPYPEGLHATLAAETGVHVRQVHRLLLEQRWAARRARSVPGGDAA
jgi:hypothetical protein